MDLITPLLIVAYIVIYYFVSKAQTSEILTLKTHIATLQDEMNAQGEMVKKIMELANLMDPEKYKKYVEFSEEVSKMEISRLTTEITKIQNKYSDLKSPSTELSTFKKELAKIILSEIIKIKAKPNSNTISAREMHSYYSSLTDAILKKLEQG